MRLAAAPWSREGSHLWPLPFRRMVFAVRRLFKQHWRGAAAALGPAGVSGNVVATGKLPARRMEARASSAAATMSAG